MDLSKYKITTEIVNAPQMKKWITERGGIVRWASVDLSDPGAGMLGPRIGPDGKLTTKPHWKMGDEPELHITDPEQVGILTEKEFKTVRIGIQRGSGFMQMVLTDSATRRVREALEEAGEGSRYVFDFDDHDRRIARIMRVDGVISLKQWMGENPNK